MRAAVSPAARAAAGSAVGIAKTAERTAVRSVSKITVRAPSTTVLIAARDRRQGVRVRIGNSVKFELHSRIEFGCLFDLEDVLRGLIDGWRK